MDMRPASKEQFALHFQREFERRKAEYEAEVGEEYGFRTAAKRIAAAHPTPAALEDKAQAARQVDSWRKQLQRCWWGRFMPTEQTRVILAEELGCDPAMFGVGVVTRAATIVGGGTHYADVLESIAAARRHIDKLEQQVVLLAEAREGVAA